MNANVFEYAIQPNAFIEAIRYATFVLGLIVMLAGLHRWLEHVRPWGSASWMFLGIFTCVQELTVIGDPFYPWRLSLLILMNVCALRQLWLDVRGGRVPR